MRLATIASLASALLLCAAAVRAADEKVPDSFQCSNHTLRGDYGFTIDGTLTLPPPAPSPLVRGVARQHFDGHGNHTQVDFVSIGGVPQSTDWRPASGTYEVNPDCTGTMTIDFDNGSPSLALHFVVVDGGRQILTAVDGRATGSVGTKIR